MILKMLILASLIPVAGFAESWSGALVNSKCYEARARNVNARDPHVSRNIGSDIRYCSPNAKTKVFGIVRQDGACLNFDSAGNIKGAEFIRTANKPASPAPYVVTVVGEMNGDVVKVESISSHR